MTDRTPVTPHPAPVTEFTLERYKAAFQHTRNELDALAGYCDRELLDDVVDRLRAIMRTADLLAETG